MAINQTRNPQKSAKKQWQKFIPLLVLVAGLGGILWLMRSYGIAFDDGFWLRLANNYQAITGWIATNLFLASLGFFAMYTIAVAFSLPGALFLTLTAGALFGWLAGVIVVTAATSGALIVFLAARGALADLLTRSSSTFVSRLKAGFDRSPFFWLLALRLMPVAPFWVVNIIPAVLGMRAVPYTLATMFGIIPGSLVFVYTGIGFSEILAQGRAPDVSNLTDHRILGPILALSLLALIPAIVRSWRGNKKTDKSKAGA